VEQFKYLGATLTNQNSIQEEIKSTLKLRNACSHSVQDLLSSSLHVAHMGEGRGAYRILVGRPEGRNHLEDPGIDGRIILKWIFKKWDGGAWTGLIWFRIGTGGGALMNAVMNLSVP
jgi:hypothetical protein